MNWDFEYIVLNKVVRLLTKYHRKNSYQFCQVWLKPHWGRTDGAQTHSNSPGKWWTAMCCPFSGHLWGSMANSWWHFCPLINPWSSSHIYVCMYMSNSHYNRLTQSQSLLFCYLFTIQLELTKWTQTCVTQYKEIIEHAIWIKWSLISPKIKILLINLGVNIWNGMSGSVEGYNW